MNISYEQKNQMIKSDTLQSQQHKKVRRHDSKQSHCNCKTTTVLLLHISNMIFEM